MNTLLAYRTAPGSAPVPSWDAPFTPETSARKEPINRRSDPRVQAHFHASATLYKQWSPEGHLHFGHWRWPMSLFDRKAMLEAMVLRVADELRLTRGACIADLGCGYGAAARLLAHESGFQVDAFTVVPEQVAEGERACAAEGLARHVTIHERDFRSTGFDAGSVDGVIGLESLCYGTGTGKGDVLAEAARILKSGGRIALVDGFLLKRPQGWRRRMVRTVERGWALPCFAQRDAFVAAMKHEGFTDIRITDLSWRVAPSAAHGLWLMIRGWLNRRLKSERLDALEQAHLRSCLLGMVLGTQHDLFRYLMITARKG
ncbi:MAG: methyltransferase domain-containing protein [Flavobacteriales bacterium]|nr:methyltransferase domain-containing protein [Flavobacteriales bacterium]